MYSVICEKYSNASQQILFSSFSKADAEEQCFNLAKQYVLKHEGDKYEEFLDKYLDAKKRSQFLPVGYSFVRSKSQFVTYTVLLKEKNGVFLHGDCKKVRRYKVLMTPISSDWHQNMYLFIKNIESIYNTKERMTDLFVELDEAVYQRGERLAESEFRESIIEIKGQKKIVVNYILT